MGQITTGVGLISGLDIQAIVDQLIAIEARPKELVEQRNAVLTSQQVAFTTVNAALLGLKNSTNSLIDDSAFSATNAFSSNESILSVSSGVGAVPGNYQFTVKQLVAAQRTVSKGFADTDATPIGAGVLTFDRGEARLDSKTTVDRLNGGQGLDRGILRVTDRSGASTIVDLSEAVTIDDVLNAFNNNININVIASIDGDRLVLTDNTGQTASDLVVADIGLGTTAASIGLRGNSGGTDTLSGSQINTLGVDTLLADLNDGNGVRRTQSTDDLTITVSGGAAFAVNLSTAQTVGDVIDAINTAAADAGVDVTASVAADGVSLAVTNNTGGALSIAAANGSQAVNDLGLNVAASGGTIDGERLVAALNSKLVRNLNGGDGLNTSLNPTGLTGSTNLADLFGGVGLGSDGTTAADLDLRGRNNFQYLIDLDAFTTVQDLIDGVDTATSGNFSVTIEGNALRITDNTTTGVAPTRVFDAGASTAAADLGWAPFNSSNPRTILGIDTNPADGALVPGTVRIQDRSGATADIDLSTDIESVSDILDAINNAGIGVVATLNQAGNGIQITDTTGGTGDLVISDLTGGSAAALQIDGTYASDTVNGGDLDLRYVTESSTLDQLGISRGRFRITDSSGASATVDLTQGDEVTLQDVIDEINSRGLQINARLNDSGDGLLIEDLGPGNVKLRVEDDGSTTARDLGILGEAANFGENIDGSFEKTIIVEATDTLTDLQNKINEADLGITASIINDGSSGNPYRLSLSSDEGGADSAFVFDDGGLDLQAVNLSEAQDAVVFFGGNTGQDALLITSASNTLDTLIPGADVTLNATSDQPVQVTISRDDEAITSSVSAFVNSFNSLMDTIDGFDTYNADTEERGLLLGDSTIGSVRQTLYNAVIGRNSELSSQFAALSQVGITVGSGARLQFDQSKFNAALAEDRDAVEALFTFKEEDDDGNITAAGVGVRLDELLERLTDTETGSIQSRIDGIDDQIALNNRRIEQLDEALAAKRERLTNEFIAMERALAELQSQGSALNSLSGISANNSSSE